MRSCTKTAGWLEGKKRQLATQAKQKEERIKVYLAAPKLCKQCSNPISYKDKKRGKSFCNKHCSAVFNNSKKIKKSKPCLSCNTPIFKYGNKFCSYRCNINFKQKKILQINIKLLKLGLLDDRKRPAIKKAMLAIGIKNACSICGIESWLNKPIPLILDHIDGSANNNKLTNLRFLCSNCDSQTEHYKNKNRGKGRKSLGLI